jgi:signal transduction histidine kinase
VADAGSLGEHVVVLSPEEPLLRATWEAVWPTVAVAAASLGVLVPAGYRAVRRLSRRFEAVEGQVARIADGEFGSRVEQSGDGCAEIERLADGVNRMSLALARMRESLVAGERQRMLGQLAAGFAHELRNAVTGARLAIELHARRCHAATDGEAGGRLDDSLGVALRQLALLESEVHGLLALAREGRRPPPDRFDMGGVVREVADLVGPRCAHAGVSLECRPPDANAARVPSRSGPWVEGRREGLRSALLNVVLNAVDAAGRGGRVRIEAEAVGGSVLVGVEDTGPGPPDAIRDSLAEPFVTTKPEGLGLGLAVARAVVLEHGGSLDWDREGGCTRFTLSLPAPAGSGNGDCGTLRAADPAGRGPGRRTEARLA